MKIIVFRSTAVCTNRNMYLQSKLDVFYKFTNSLDYNDFINNVCQPRPLGCQKITLKFKTNIVYVPTPSKYLIPQVVIHGHNR